jgi:hypothetical protein
MRLYDMYVMYECTFIRDNQKCFVLKIQFYIATVICELL